MKLKLVLAFLFALGVAALSTVVAFADWVERAQF